MRPIFLGVGILGLVASIILGLSLNQARLESQAATATSSAATGTTIARTQRASSIRLTLTQRAASTDTAFRILQAQLPAFQRDSPLISSFPNAQLQLIDEFESSMISSRWAVSEAVEADPNGYLNLEGVQFWATGLSREITSYSAGEGVLILFQYSSDVEMEIHFDAGSWQSTTYRRWGVYIEPNNYRASNSIRTNVFRGASFIGDDVLTGNLFTRSDTWYYVFIGILPDDEFVAMIWEKDNPEQYRTITRTYDEFSPLSFAFRIGINQGTLIIDSIADVSLGIE